MFTRSLLLVAPFALRTLAQSSSHTNGSAAATTLNLFLDSEPDQEWVGSIVNADACETTIALACTEGDYGFGQYSFTCDGSANARYTFQGSTGFGLSTEVNTATQGVDVAVQIIESCSLQPSRMAVCSVTDSISIEDITKTKTQSTLTYSGEAASQKWFQVPITGGAEKLPAPTATCTANANAAAATGVSELYKIVVVPAAAMLAAGAAL